MRLLVVASVCSATVWLFAAVAFAQINTTAASLTLTATPAEKGATITWTTSNAMSCIASQGNPGWAGVKTATGGSTTVTPTVTTAFAMECWSVNGFTSGLKILYISPNGVVGSATTNTNNTATLTLINQLLAQIATLQQQLNALNGVTSTGTGSDPACSYKYADGTTGTGQTSTIQSTATNESTNFFTFKPEPVNTCGVSFIVTDSNSTPEQLAILACLDAYQAELHAWEKERDIAYEKYLQENPPAPSPFTVGPAPLAPTCTTAIVGQSYPGVPNLKCTCTSVGITMPTTPAPALTQNLSLGSTGPEVSALQSILVSLGYMTKENISGYFGPITEAAVKKFQCDKEIVCTGTPSTTGYGAVGPLTRTALNAAVGTSGTTSMCPSPGTMWNGISCVSIPSTSVDSRLCTTASGTTGSQTYNSTTKLWGSCTACGMPNEFVVGPTPLCASSLTSVTPTYRYCSTTSGSGYQTFNTTTSFWGSCTACAMNNEFTVGPTPPCPASIQPPTTTVTPTTIKFETANSASGPWAENASLCNDPGRKIYTRLTNVSKTNPPKGCSDLTTNTGCLNLANHRVFTDAEWLNSNTIQTVLDGGVIQNGSFNSYVSYPESAPIKVGSFQLKQCASTTPSPVCAYESFVFGPAPACTKELEGNTQYGSRCTCTTP